MITRWSKVTCRKKGPETSTTHGRQRKKGNNIVSGLTRDQKNVRYSLKGTKRMTRSSQLR